MPMSIDTARLDNLSDMPTVVGQTRVWHLGGNWSIDSANRPQSSVKVRLFAQLLRMYTYVLRNSDPTAPEGGHYPSDLYHDALTIEGWTLTESLTFTYECDSWGTYLFLPELSGDLPDGRRRNRWVCTVWPDLSPFETHPWLMSATCTRWDAS